MAASFAAATPLIAGWLPSMDLSIGSIGPQQTYLSKRTSAMDLSNVPQQCTSAMDQVASLATEHLAARIAHKFDKRVHAARRVAVSHIKKWKQNPVVHAVLLLK
jgi:hypothetical protein